MTAKSRTIDNLGIETSQRYARDIEELDRSLIAESQQVSKGAEVISTTPSFPSEIEKLLGIAEKNESWAFFFAPPHFTSHTRRIFTSQLAPSLGSQEHQQAEAEKIESFAKYSEEDKENNEEEKEGSSLFDKKGEEEEKEKDALVSLFKIIGKLDHLIIAINSRRNQYHKG